MLKHLHLGEIKKTHKEGPLKVKVAFWKMPKIWDTLMKIWDTIMKKDYLQSLLRICLKRQKKKNKHGQYIFIIVYNRI